MLSTPAGRAVRDASYPQPPAGCASRARPPDDTLHELYRDYNPDSFIEAGIAVINFRAVKPPRSAHRLEDARRSPLSVGPDGYRPLRTSTAPLLSPGGGRQPPSPNVDRGAIAKYARLVGSALAGTVAVNLGDESDDVRVFA